MNIEYDPFAGPVLLGTAPTTEHQREIWTASQLGDDASLAYNESVRLELDGKLNVAAFQSAFSEVLLRHEILNASISVDGMTLCLHAPEEGRLAVRDFCGLDASAQSSELLALSLEEVTLPFDLTTASLYRAHLVRLSETRTVFVFTAHHIICDGWSLAVIVKDLGKFYTRAVLGFEEKSPVTLTYSDYARGEASRDPKAQAEDEQHFLRSLNGELPILELPLSKTRPSRRTFRSRREDHTLESSLIGRIRQVGIQRKASLFATLLSAFTVTVARIANQEDVIIGVPFAGQSLTGHEDLVGHAVNLLPLRFQLDLNAEFPTLLDRARGAIVDAQEHQGTTIGRLLQKLPIPRDPSRIPLVSVTFNLDKGLPNAALGFQDLEGRLSTNPRQFENFEVFINAVETEGRIDLECQYNADLFDALSIRRFLFAYERVLESIAEDPTKTLRALNILPAQDRDLLTKYNNTGAIFPEGVTVDQLVEKIALASPDQIACEFQDEKLSYAELLQRADDLAAHLRRTGAEPGKYVGVCLDRSLDLLIGVLAVWRAGAAYVPLDPDYPSERLRMMVEDSKMAVLVTSSRLAAELPLGVSETLLVDALPRDVSPNQRVPSEARSSENTAYVIFTSGSTGRPKGVMVPHRAVVNLLGSVAKRPGLTTNDVVLAITTLSFDIAVSEIWLPLVVGAKIVLTTRDVASDGHLLKDLILRRGVSFIDATPATYRLLLAAGWQGHGRLKLICTGEAMPSDLGRQLLGCSGQLWNGYGPTETTVWSTFWQAQPGFEKVLIGRPVDNTQIHILDEAGSPVPLGTRGEIYIGGAGVSHGYLGRPDLTEERFVPDPFSTGTYPTGNPDIRMYRTGDLGRYLRSGEIECLGRNDHQVKLRGFRIELGEIETALAAHANVRQATVVLREDTPGDAKLVAYFIAEGEAPPQAELRAHLKTRLPDYMVPAVYLSMADLPLTPSGKIDRKALPAPTLAATTESAEFVAPRTPSEAILASLWAEVLRLPRISVEDDFFALGGHSLLASQILGRLRRDHGVELSFRKFFEAPTIAQLALAVDAVSQSGVARREPLRPREPFASIPLTISQERQLLLEEMDPAQRIAHNLPAAWEFRGQVSQELLQRSLDLLVARHETLRTTFGGEPGHPLQRVLNKVDLELEKRDLRSLPESERDPAMRREIQEVSRLPFNLEKGPLFRAMLFQFEEERFVFFSLRHNIIWDGWSFDIFLSELSAAYSAYAEEREPVLPALPISYGDYAIWHRAELRSPLMQEHIEWWKNELANAPADMALPKDFPRATQSTHAGGNAKLTLSKDYSAKLTEVAHRAGTTFFMALYASYVALLHRYSGEKDLLVGLPVRGRYLPELDNLIGPFTNTIILRCEVRPEESFLEHLKRVRDRSLEAFSHEETPLELLSAHLPPVRALFSFQDTRERPKLLGDISIEQTDVEHPAAANDLMIWAVERHDRIIAIANYNSEIFTKASIERFLRSFQAILSAAIEDPETKIADLNILAPEDKEATDALAVSAEVSESPTDAVGLLQHRVALSPDALATQGRHSKTFRELDEDSSKIAASLGARGLTPGGTVLVDLPPSYELLSAVYGVWKAGAVVYALASNSPAPFQELCLGTLPFAFCIHGGAAPSGLGATIPAADVKTLAEHAVNQEPIEISHPALLLASLTDDGNVRREALSHASLTAAALSLSEVLRGDVNGGLWVELNPLHESFGVHLLLGPASGLALHLEPARTPADGLLDAIESERLFAISASASVVAEASSEAKRAPKRIVVWGPNSGTELSPWEHVADVFTCRTHRGAELVGTGDFLLFGSAYDTRIGLHYGRPLRSGVGLRVCDPEKRVLPFGVVGLGELVRGSESGYLGLSGALRSDGVFARVPESRTLLASPHSVHVGFLARLLARHPGIKEAYAVVEDTLDGSREIVAYYSADLSTALTESDLRRYLKENLPEFLVPRRLIAVDGLPRSVDGSVEIHSLPSPFRREVLEFVEARTKSERLLVRLYQDILGKPRVSIHDNFFDLGGHSLLCLRLVVEIERETGRRLSPRIILLNTVAQTASSLDASEPSADTGPTHASEQAANAKDHQGQGFAGRMLKGIQGLFGGDS